MNKSLIEQKKALSRTWNLLSALFCQPEVDIHGDKKVYDELGQSLQNLEKEITNDAESLWEYYESAGQQSVLIEYTRLFIGPFKTIAPPYSSVYLSNDGTVFGAETQQVLDFYHQSGVEFDFSINELPDHIAVELEFLHYLSAQEISALENENLQLANQYIRHQNFFFNNHLKRWLPSFCDRIIEGTANQYYLVLASILKKLVNLQLFFPEN